MDRNWVEIKKNLGIIEKALKNKNKFTYIKSKFLQVTFAFWSVAHIHTYLHVKYKSFKFLH